MSKPTVVMAISRSSRSRPISSRIAKEYVVKAAVGDGDALGRSG